MNTDDNVKITPPRTNKRSVPVIVGVITLAVGILIGLAVTKTRAGNSAPETVAMTPTNGMSSATNSALSAAGPVEWNPFQEIRDLQTQMDQLFSQMNARFSTGNRPNFSVVNPGYSFSLNVQDLKDRYEVHAYVPDTQTSHGCRQGGVV